MNLHGNKLSSRTNAFHQLFHQRPRARILSSQPNKNYSYKREH